jgi:hypothetical protein
MPSARSQARVVPREQAPGKRVAAAFSIILLVVVASPIIENWRSPPHDDFPLSYYRMFSEVRSDTQRVTYLVGLDSHGERMLLPYRYAGSGGMNQVRRQINKRVKQGDASRLCRTVASRVGRAGSRLPELQAIEITTGTFRMSDYFRGRSAPVSENVSARCAVDQSRR